MDFFIVEDTDPGAVNSGGFCGVDMVSSRLSRFEEHDEVNVDDGTGRSDGLMAVNAMTILSFVCERFCRFTEHEKADLQVLVVNDLRRSERIMLIK